MNALLTDEVEHFMDRMKYSTSERTAIAAVLKFHATVGRKELDKEASARAHDTASTFGNYEMTLVDAVVDAVISTLVDS